MQRPSRLEFDTISLCEFVCKNVILKIGVWYHFNLWICLLKYDPKEWSLITFHSVNLFVKIWSKKTGCIWFKSFLRFLSLIKKERDSFCVSCVSHRNRTFTFWFKFVGGEPLLLLSAAALIFCFWYLLAAFFICLYTAVFCVPVLLPVSITDRNFALQRAKNSTVGSTDFDKVAMGNVQVILCHKISKNTRDSKERDESMEWKK